MADERNIRNGREIPTERYSDQPYIVQTADGAWLCVMTTGQGHEGEPGQHVVTMRSQDCGRTWSEPVEVEPADGPESSYAVLLAIPGGRIFCFYNHNTDNTRKIKADPSAYPDGYCRRVDSQGHFVFKYSDDHGRSWSKNRYDIPMRLMNIDRENPYGGSILFFWNVGKAFLHDGSAYVPLHKVGGFGHGFFTRSEGVLLRSSNLLTEIDVGKISWETLPEGDYGLKAPPGGGPIAEEHSFSVLSDGSLYCVYRSVDGHPVCTYSRDNGRSWTGPVYQTYADGRLMKHPRAANFAWRCKNGYYLYWFHNHGGRDYEDRNPVWLAGGREIDTESGKMIAWSQPEIVLYDDDPFIRMSYPDLIETEDAYYLCETQKDKARIHQIDPKLLTGLWHQVSADEIAADGLEMAISAHDQPLPRQIPMPHLPSFFVRDQDQPDYRGFHTRAGFSFELLLQLKTVDTCQTVFDNRRADGKGFCLRLTQSHRLEILLHDGRTENRWLSDAGMLKPDRTHHIVVTMDGGPCIITYVIDGKLCDGGNNRQFGWGRFSPYLRDVNGLTQIELKDNPAFKILQMRLYGRALRTSEAIGNFRSLSKPGAK